MGRAAGTSEPRTPRRTFENIGHGLESSRAGEATSGCNRGAAVEADRRNRGRGAAVEADAIREQQLKRMQTGNSSHEADRCNRGAAAEADAIREQQLCMHGELSGAG